MRKSLERFCSTWNIILLVGWIGVLAGCAKKKEALVVGMDLSYPPFETIDEAGRPRGVSVELAKALAQYLGKPLEIENIPFVGLIPSLQNGRIDCVISSMTDSPERRESLDFSEPYLSTGLAMLVGKNGGLTDFTGVDQPGRTVVVRQGTTGQLWAQANVKKAKLVALEKENSAVLEVAGGRADAFIYDQMSVWSNWRKNPDTTRAVLAPLREERWAIGIKKGNGEFKREIDAFLVKFRAEGGFDRLSEEFLKEQKKAFQEQGIRFVF